MASNVSQQDQPAPAAYPGELAPYFWGAHIDQYGWRVNSLIEFMNRLDYPVGVIPWLENAARYLYDCLTRTQPERISHAWNAKAPCDEFDALCRELEQTHHRAVALYRQYLSRLPATKEIAGS